jgi:hypothetical protein
MTRIKRGLNITYFGNAWDNVPYDMMKDYKPTNRDIKIIRTRIKQRLNK